MKKKFVKWMFVAAWCLLIFLFSQQSGEVSSSNNKFIEGILMALGIDVNSVFNGNGSLVIRKLAHITEYFVLYFLTYNALSESVNAKKSLTFAMVFTVIYASLDEFHQSFIPGRAPQIRDVIIDSSGGVLCAFIIFIRSKSIFKPKRSYR